jgi:hypothetical protein
MAMDKNRVVPVVFFKKDVPARKPFRKEQFSSLYGRSVRFQKIVHAVDFTRKRYAVDVIFPFSQAFPADGLEVRPERPLVITQFIAALKKKLLVVIAPNFLHDGKCFLFHGLIIPKNTKKVNKQINFYHCALMNIAG